MATCADDAVVRVWSLDSAFRDKVAAGRDGNAVPGAQGAALAPTTPQLALDRTGHPSDVPSPSPQQPGTTAAAAARLFASGGQRQQPPAGPQQRQGPHCSAVQPAVQAARVINAPANAVQQQQQPPSAAAATPAQPCAEGTSGHSVPRPSQPQAAKRRRQNGDLEDNDVQPSATRQRTAAAGAAAAAGAMEMGAGQASQSPQPQPPPPRRLLRSSAAAVAAAAPGVAAPARLHRDASRRTRTSSSGYGLDTAPAESETSPGAGAATSPAASIGAAAAAASVSVLHQDSFDVFQQDSGVSNDWWNPHYHFHPEVQEVFGVPLLPLHHHRQPSDRVLAERPAPPASTTSAPLPTSGSSADKVGPSEGFVVAADTLPSNPTAPMPRSGGLSNLQGARSDAPCPSHSTWLELQAERSVCSVQDSYARCVAELMGDLLTPEEVEQQSPRRLPRQPRQMRRHRQHDQDPESRQQGLYPEAGGHDARAVAPDAAAAAAEATGGSPAAGGMPSVAEDKENWLAGDCSQGKMSMPDKRWQADCTVPPGATGTAVPCADAPFGDRAVPIVGHLPPSHAPAGIAGSGYPSKILEPERAEEIPDGLLTRMSSKGACCDEIHGMSRDEQDALLHKSLEELEQLLACQAPGPVPDHVGKRISAHNTLVAALEVCHRVRKANDERLRGSTDEHASAAAQLPAVVGAQPAPRPPRHPTDTSQQKQRHPHLPPQPHTANKRPLAKVPRSGGLMQAMRSTPAPQQQQQPVVRSPLQPLAPGSYVVLPSAKIKLAAGSGGSQAQVLFYACCCSVIRSGIFLFSCTGCSFL